MSEQEKLFPIQAERGAKPFPMCVPWSVAELAYSVYASLYGKSQSLDRLAQRGGFAPSEMDQYAPGWRERCDALTDLLRQLSQAQEQLAAVKAERDRLWEVNRQQKAALDAMPRVDRRTPLSQDEARIITVNEAVYMVPVEIHDAFARLRAIVDLAVAWQQGFHHGRDISDEGWSAPDGKKQDALYDAVEDYADAFVAKENQ